MNFLGMGKDCGWCDDESSSPSDSDSDSSSSPAPPDVTGPSCLACDGIVPFELSVTIPPGTFSGSDSDFLNTTWVMNTDNSLHNNSFLNFPCWWQIRTLSPNGHNTTILVSRARAGFVVTMFFEVFVGGRGRWRWRLVTESLDCLSVFALPYSFFEPADQGAYVLTDTSPMNIGPA